MGSENGPMNAWLRHQAGLSAIERRRGVTEPEQPEDTVTPATAGPPPGDGGPRGRPVAGNQSLDTGRFMNTWMRLQHRGWTDSDAAAQARDEQWFGT